jgi:hypothetical protein
MLSLPRASWVFLFLLLTVHMTFLSCGISRHERSEAENHVLIQVVCDEFDDAFYYPIPAFEKKDLLGILAELSVSENPSIRFISTNQTEEIMEINGRRTSWKEGWNLYLNGKYLSPSDLKRGLKVGSFDTIRIKLETTERVFGIPTKHGDDEKN